MSDPAHHAQRGGRSNRPAPPTGQLRLTARGRVVLAVIAILLVALCVTAVRALVGGEDATVAVEPPAPSCTPNVDTSQNCWPAITDGQDPALESSEWITGRVLGGDVRTVLDYVAARFNATVEPVDPASSWGWAHRSVRGEDGDADQLSNHASGTSIDLNAPEHPLGATDTFTGDQVAAIRSILAEVSPVVAWGGDFDGRVDEMHFEIVGDEQAVAQVAARLRGE